MDEQRQMILGVDFDDTLFLNSFPDNYNEPNWHVINYVKSKKQNGWYVILVTCRTNPDLVNGALQACKDIGIEFDAVNENHPSLIAEYGDCRKIFCDEYIDDKNVTIRQIEPTQMVMEMPKRPVVYIAGKMRGLPGLGKDHFDVAEEMLRQTGFITLNPASLPIGLNENDYLPICLAMLNASDCIYLLDGWQYSKGAVAEYAYAVCQGKDIMFESEEGLVNGTEENATECE